MTRQQRAKQFQPFDAMKGLQEALRDREERHSRVERHDILEEAILRNSRVISMLTKGMAVRLEYYCSFHDVQKDGVVTEINVPFRYLKIGTEKICFEDIYSIRMIDVPLRRK